MQVQNNNNNNTVSNIFDDVHVKVQYGNELRRFSMKRINCTGTGTVNSLYNCLVDKIALLFAIPRNFQLKYKDDEGDQITITSDDELKFAINLFLNSTLRFNIDVVPLHTSDDMSVGWKGHKLHHGWKGPKVHHGWKRHHVAHGLNKHHGWKGHNGFKGNNEWMGSNDSHDSWKGHCRNDEKMERGGRKGCRGRGGWSLEHIENKIVMVSKKRDVILEKIENMKKENSSEENLKGLECILRRLDSRLIKLKQFESEKNNTSDSTEKNNTSDSTCQKKNNEKKETTLCNTESKCQGRGRKWCNDPLSITVYALKKEKRELRLALRNGFESESEKDDAKKRIKVIQQEICQIIMNRRKD